MLENRKDNQITCVTVLLRITLLKTSPEEKTKNKTTQISKTNDFLILKQCTLQKHMEIMMSSKITANMLHGKEQGSHYRGSMTGMRWPLTPGKKVGP